MAILVFLLNVVLWVAYELLVDLPLYLLGFPVCYTLARLGKIDLVSWQEYARGKRDHWSYRWAWVWDNSNDGVTGPEWYHMDHHWPLWKFAFVWSAWRNPTNNLRLVSVLHPVIDSRRIKYVGNSMDPAHTYPHPGEGVPARDDRPFFEWAFTWQGVYGGLVLRVNWTKARYSQFRWGWKLLPHDIVGVDPEDDRAVRCPFGLQLHFWRASK